jgi:hypothetical protein
VPTYRVYYAERMPRGAGDWKKTYGLHRWGSEDQRLLEHEEVEWEEDVEATDVGRALDSFFKQHVRDNTQLMWVDEAGDGHEVEGVRYEPEKTYIWIEDDKLMEYQGMDETTPGMVTCPLCGGEGEVEESIADEFLAEDEEEGEGGVTWG